MSESSSKKIRFCALNSDQESCPAIPSPTTPNYLPAELFRSPTHLDRVHGARPRVCPILTNMITVVYLHAHHRHGLSCSFGESGGGPAAWRSSTGINTLMSTASQSPFGSADENGVQVQVTVTPSNTFDSPSVEGELKRREGVLRLNTRANSQFRCSRQSVRSVGPVRASQRSTNFDFRVLPRPARSYVRSPEVSVHHSDITHSTHSAHLDLTKWYASS